MLKKSVINADNEGKVFVILTWFDSTAVRCSNTELKLKTMVSETIIVNDCLHGDLCCKKEAIGCRYKN